MQPENEPLIAKIISDGASIVYIVFVSSLAGAIGYLNRIRRRMSDFSWPHLFINFLVGGLNGYLVFLMCDASDYSWQATAFLTGASGAMGSELLNAMLSKIKSNMTGEAK